MDVYAAIANNAHMRREEPLRFTVGYPYFQLDSGNLVVVPMDGRMVTHFIDTNRESASLFHNLNNHFDSSNLSLEFLFSRFAWAII
jgi:hypothetical protein